MKKFSFLALAAAGMLFAACSSDKDVAAGVPQTTEVGEGYLALSINLPTAPQSITRATDDNGSGAFDLDDGLETEYDVKDAYLLVFKPGASEDAATFKTAFNITTQWVTNGDPHVTVNSKNVVKKVGTTIAEGDLALVVLNRNNIYTFAPKTGTTVDEVTVKVGTTDLSTSTTFGDLRKMIVANSAIDNASEMTTTGFYMTNSPLFAKKGSTKDDDPTGTTFRTLVPIEHVYPTEEAAKSGVASEIFVERGMAKVTLEQLTDAKLGTKTTDDAELAITIEGWTLDQTNQKSYLIRSTDDINTFDFIKNGVSQIYRFTGNTAIQDANNPGDFKYRGYFAIDPNFTGGKGELTHISETDAAVFKNTFGVENPQYCFENTFDVANQLRQNTTLVQLKVKVGSGDDLYTVNGSTSSIYKLAAVETLIKNAVLTFLNSKGLVGTASSTDVGAVTLANNTTDATVQDIKTVAITDDGTKFKTGAAAAVTADLAASDSKIKAAVGTIVKYTGGISYYAIRVKHFGDELTPWHVGTKSHALVDTWMSVWDPDGQEKAEPTAGNVYPANDYDDYLGRYGMLRNNWYDLRVTKIKTLGSAKPINYTEDPTTDDELDGYINVKINVLSWARRTQNWSL